MTISLLQKSAIKAIAGLNNITEEDVIKEVLNQERGLDSLSHEEAKKVISFHIDKWEDEKY